MDKMKLLYVEDIEEIRTAVRLQMEYFFSNDDYELILAENGSIGLEKYHNDSPDLIITDIDMPVINGIEMIKIIRLENVFIPIIITSAFDPKQYYEFMQNYNISEYFTKPFCVKTLTDRIN